MAKAENHFIRGRAFWAKVLGDPVPNYDKNGFEWTIDLALDKDGVKQLESLQNRGKPVFRIKSPKDPIDTRYVSFKQKQLRSNGDPNNPIRVIDATGADWDQNSKLGNGTVVDLKFEIRDYGEGKFPGVYPRAIRVLDHVKYEAQEFAPLSKDDEFFREAPAEVAKSTDFDDLEGDIPE